MIWQMAMAAKILGRKIFLSCLPTKINEGTHPRPLPTSFGECLVRVKGYNLVRAINAMSIQIRLRQYGVHQKLTKMRAEWLVMNERYALRG